MQIMKYICSSQKKLQFINSLGKPDDEISFKREQSV